MQKILGLASINISQIFHNIEYENNRHCISVVTRAVLWCVIAQWTATVAIHSTLINITSLIHTPFNVRLLNGYFILPCSLFKNLKKIIWRLVNLFDIFLLALLRSKIYEIRHWITSSFAYLFSIFLIGTISINCFNFSSIL